MAARTDSIPSEKPSAAGSNKGNATEPLGEISKSQWTSDTGNETASPFTNDAPGKDDHEYITGTKLNLILAAVTLVYFLVMLDGSIVATAIPAITTQFHSLLDVGWYGSAYQLANASLQPLSGKIYTYCTTKWAFLVFFAIFEFGSLLCGVATSSVMLIVGRAVAGLGASGLMNGALTILSACVPSHRQPVLMGTLVALGQIGIALGPLLGGAFTQDVSWRWCFYINLPIGGLVAVLLLFVHVPERGTKQPFLTVLRTAVRSFDLIGFAIFAPAAIEFFLALEYGGNQYAWNSSVVIGLFCGAGATFIVFLAWEYRMGDDAMVPLSMISQRIVWSSCVLMFFFMGSLFSANYYLPIYFQAVKDASPIMSGVDVLPTILSQVLMAMVSGVTVQVMGYYLPWVLSGTALATIAYGLLSTFTPSTSTGRWIGYQIIFGIGCGSGATMAYIALQSFVKPAQIPVAMAIMVFCQTFGGGLWLAVAQTIFSNSLVDAIRRDAPGVDPAVVVQAGARAVRNVVSVDQLSGVLKAYTTAVTRVMYLGIGLSVGAFIFAWGLGWKDVRKAKDTKVANEENKDDPAV